MKYILFVAALCLGSLRSAAQCPNGDLESGTFSGWKGYTGNNSSGTLNLSAFTAGFDASRHAIVSPATDPVVGSPYFNQVANGNYAARLGNTGSGAQAEIISYRFRLTQDFAFNYALVLQDPHSSLVQNPFFSYWISLSDSLPVSKDAGHLLAQEQIIADSTSFFKSITYSGSNLVYREWTRECVMLKFPSLYSYVGQFVTIYFATADCSAGAHFGYAYIDDLCRYMWPAATFTCASTVHVSPSAPLMVDGSASRFETEHYWKINQCTATGTDITSYPTVTTPVQPFMAGAVNLRPFTSSSYFILDKYYKITLYVRNCIGGWVASPPRIIRVVL